MTVETRQVDPWKFFSDEREGGIHGYAVAQESSLWPHYIREFVINGQPGKIFSHAIKAPPSAISLAQGLAQSAVAPPQQAPSAALEVGQPIYAFYPVNGIKAGYAVAQITITNATHVTYAYTDGTLFKQALTIPKDLAQAGRTAYLAQSTAPSPAYSGSFKSVNIFKCEDKELKGTYLATTNPQRFSNGKPIFLKETAIPGFITVMSYRDDQKWVISCFNGTNQPISDTDYIRHPVYAKTATAAEWPHRTHDYVLNEDGEKIKVYSYSVKSNELLVASESDKDDNIISLLNDSEDSDDTLVPRVRRPPARDATDPTIVNHFAGTAVRRDKKRKGGVDKSKSKSKSSKTSSSGGAAGGGADGGGAAGGSVSTEGLR